jgi:hypothetical protein
MIDTLKLSSRLEGAGMERRQAEERADGLAEGLRSSVEARLDRIEGRLDRVDGELADIRGDLKLLKWMVGVVMALATGVPLELLMG